jgi:hypothetical protein
MHMQIGRAKRVTKCGKLAPAGMAAMLATFALLGWALPAHSSAVAAPRAWSLVAVAQPVLRSGERQALRTYESGAPFVPANRIDELLVESWQRQGIEPAGLCSDAVFIRRVYLDVIGTLPTAEEVRAFLADERTDKRSRLVDALLERPEFADYWALKWGDLLRIKAEFPINLWPNAVQAYHGWVRQCLSHNVPYDQFARELLTSSGSNFRVPPVNFYRAVQGRTPEGISNAVALTLMGTRLENWSPEERAQFAKFFSRVAYKSTAEWKEEIVFLDPAPCEAFEATLPDGTQATIGQDEDPRRVFADWLITAENPWFARSIVNRLWSWLLGRGIVHEPDDLRPDNPAVHPELLAYLAAELVREDYDLKHMYRLILNSHTYQQSCRPVGNDPRAAELFACYPVRRLEAEVLIDALNQVLGSNEAYVSRIPEPFTYIPEQERTIRLADGSITSPFLELFGRPPRDTGLESERNNQPTKAQRLHLLNSTNVQKKIAESRRLRSLFRQHRNDIGKLAEVLYLELLSRPPTAAEVRTIRDYLGRQKFKRREALHDVVWALVNSKEFAYRH